MVGEGLLPRPHRLGGRRPGPMGPVAHPQPVAPQEIAPRRKAHAQRKSRMDQRTRERMPVLPALVAHVGPLPAQPPSGLPPQSPAPPTGHSPREENPSPGGDPARLGRKDLGRRAPRPPSAETSSEEHRAFWSWAAVEVAPPYRRPHRGARPSSAHHSFVEYTVPPAARWSRCSTSCRAKTDTERLLVIKPGTRGRVERDHPSRLRTTTVQVPLVVAYDYTSGSGTRPPRCCSNAATRRTPPDRRPTIRSLLARALADSGLTTPAAVHCTSLRMTSGGFSSPTPYCTACHPT